MTTFLPKKTFVLIGALERQKTTESGIVITGSEGIGESKTAKVLAVGPDVKDVEVDDEVLILWPKAQVVTIDGNQRLIIKEEDIVAVVER